MTASANLPTSASALLMRMGVRMAGGSDRWHLDLPDGQAHPVQVKARQHPPTPSWIEKLRHLEAGTTYLIVTTRITPYLRTQAQQGSLDVIDVENEVAIIAGTTYATTPAEQRSQPSSRTRGRKPWIRWATERTLLLAEDPMTQTKIASVLAVTQQSISLALREHQYAANHGEGWLITTKREQLEHHLREYPGPGGATTYWYGLDPAVRQAKNVTDFLNGQVLQTGDVAADTYAPWRLPQTAAAYIEQIVDFTEAGFTPADATDHTLRATVPEDATIWRTAEFAAGANLADPIITLYDLLRSAGSDVTQAADRLGEAIVDGSWRG